jgi:hypothetical protein
MEREEIEDRIKRSAENTDALITKLDTLTGRIDAARANENGELTEYYERQFAEASVEFLDGVESILDGWYELRGETRPPAADEYISPETLDSIHSAVVSIVQGLPVDLTEETAAGHDFDQTTHEPARPADTGPRHRVDVTG